VCNLRRLWPFYRIVSRIRAGIAAFACVVVVAAPAQADQLRLGTTTAATPISASRGWVVWSAPTGAGWQLMAWHDGMVRALALAPRPAPFDADVGTDARGRAVVTFSRCTRTPSGIGGAGSPAAGWTGRGCRVRVVDLVSGRERAAGIPRSRGDSDTSPSMWRGRVAFARHAPGHRDVEQVLLFDPKQHRVVTLPHGAVPTSCPFREGCKGQPVHGGVTDLDLGARLVAFRWWVEAPAVVGHGGWEIRADVLRDRRSVLLGSGFAGEACTGGVDSSMPGAPTTDGLDVWWQQTSTACEKTRAELRRWNVATGGLVSGSLPETVIGLAYDAGALLGIVAPPPAPTPGVYSPVDSTCSAPGAPCQIERLDPPALQRLDEQPQSPFF
jgi:hypothetical protein